MFFPDTYAVTKNFLRDNPTKPSKRKIQITKKINDYVESFTVHGLTRVCRGNKLESVFWCLMLFGGILLSIIIISGLVSKYLNYGMYTEIRLEVTDRNYFPSITFCERYLLLYSYFAYCGVPHTMVNNNTSCDNISYFKETEFKSKNFWSNGKFNVTKCVTWGQKSCLNSNYLKSRFYFNNSCFTWNYNGDLHDIYSHVEIEFKFDKPELLKSMDPEIIAIPHNPEVTEIDVTNKVDIEPYKKYEIKIDKTILRRLPAPFPSNCSYEKLGDIFPGKYTRRGCIESYNYIEMYKKCGDTLDYVRNFIPDDIKRQYKKNLSIMESIKCIRSFGDVETKGITRCQFPCEDLDLGIMSTFHERNMKRYKSPIYRISLQYQRVDAYKVMEEKELYSWDQMACEIGGFIGLVIGASVISMVEIVAFVCLAIVKRFM